MTEPIDLSCQEVYQSPDECLALHDHEIAVLLKRATSQSSPVDHILSVALGHLQSKVKILVHERDLRQGMLDALAEGDLAQARGEPLEHNPYVPDEDDCKWIYWRTGWGLPR